MRRKRFGFTLIEVAFFIAITGLLFVGIIIGTQNSIWQQKYNDSVQKFADFLRNVYAEVSSTQGKINGGRSDKAIYGKMISFGQQVGLDGKDIANDQQIFVYDVVGDALGGGGNDIYTALASLRVNVLMEIDGAVDYTGIVESYTPIWGAVVEKDEPAGELFQGTILVVRNPNTGLINTITSSDVIHVNEAKNRPGVTYSSVAELLTSKLYPAEGVASRFATSEINFCLNPYGIGQTGNLRRDIKLTVNARNASGVEIVDLVNDKSINKCAK